MNKEYPGFWHAVLLCVTFIALQMVFITPFAVLQVVFKHPRLISHPAVLGAVNVSACAALVTISWFIGRPPMSDVFAFRRVSGPTIGSVLVASAGAIILLSELDNLFQILVPVPEWIVRLFNDVSSVSKHGWASLFLLVMVAPLTEEVIFRGLILRAFLRRFKPAAAFLLSSGLFGMVHLNPWQFVSASALGVLFAWWYARTQSLVPSLIGHALANAMVVGHAWLPFEVQGFNVDDPIAGSHLQPAWFDALGVLLLAAGLWLFHRATPAIHARAEVAAESQPTPVQSGPNSPPS